jgi:hypothetical protein
MQTAQFINKKTFIHAFQIYQILHFKYNQYTNLALQITSISPANISSTFTVESPRSEPFITEPRGYDH